MNILKEIKKVDLQEQIKQNDQTLKSLSKSILEPEISRRTASITTITNTFFSDKGLTVTETPTSIEYDYKKSLKIVLDFIDKPIYVFEANQFKYTVKYILKTISHSGSLMASGPDGDIKLMEQRIHEQEKQIDYIQNTAPELFKGRFRLEYYDQSERRAITHNFNTYNEVLDSVFNN